MPNPTLYSHTAIVTFELTGSVYLENYRVTRHEQGRRPGRKGVLKYYRLVGGMYVGS